MAFSLRTTPRSSALETALKNPIQFLAEHVFPLLYVDEFRFGDGRDGTLGTNMISRYVVVPARTPDVLWAPTVAGAELAIHLNCIVIPSAFQWQKKRITIRVEQFHLTARSLWAQRMIDVHGPSVVTAESSIHMNINTGWGRADNLRALAEEVGVSDGHTLRFELQSKRKYNGRCMRGLVEDFKEGVEHRIQLHLGGDVKVYWEGDGTFPN